jgi:hypothetical protein
VILQKRNAFSPKKDQKDQNKPKSTKLLAIKRFERIFVKKKKKKNKENHVNNSFFLNQSFQCDKYD